MHTRYTQNTHKNEVLQTCVYNAFNLLGRGGQREGGGKGRGWYVDLKCGHFCVLISVCLCVCDCVRVCVCVCLMAI